MATLKLKKPAMINGEETSEIEYDLDELTGKDIQDATKELQKRGIIVSVVETDPNYQAMLFAMASGLSYEDIQKLGAKDYNDIIILVRDFFL